MKRIGECKKPYTHCVALWSPSGKVFKPKDYRDKPFVLCEYAHAMNNSLGNFNDYWKEFLRYDRLAGGFIWDFADQSIKKVETTARSNGRRAATSATYPTTATLSSTVSFSPTEPRNPRCLK